MDDKFLYQLREQPDSEFVKNLYQKLSQNHSEPDRRLNTNYHSLFQSKRLILIVALLVISLIAIMTISPVRAFVSSLILNIAGQSYEVTEDYPGDNYPGDEEIIEPQVMSLGEALSIFPHDLTLPSNIPPEYVLNNDVRVYIGNDAGPFENTIEFEWLSNNKGGYILKITDKDASTSEVVAPTSLEEIFLDDNHQAVVIRGGWDADNKVWNNNLGIRLRWSVDNLTYELMGNDLEQLIEIAVSTIE